MFESQISVGGIEKLPYSENFSFSSWSYDMEGHAKKCVERYCELGECEISKDVVDSYRTMFESRLFEGTTENLPSSAFLRGPTT